MRWGGWGRSWIERALVLTYEGIGGYALVLAYEGKGIEGGCISWLEGEGDVGLAGWKMDCVEVPGIGGREEKEMLRMR